MLRVTDLEFSIVKGYRFRVTRLGLRVKGLGFGVKGLGLGFRFDG
jgi:hypothetical protein